MPVTNFEIEITPGNRLVIKPMGCNGHVIIETQLGKAPQARILLDDGEEEQIFEFPYRDLVYYPDDPDSQDITTLLDEAGYLILDEREPEVSDD